MDLEALLPVAFAVGALLLIAFVRRSRVGPKPKERTFVCAGCKAPTPHTNRTIEAWRSNKTRFFCSACHRKWLASKPGNRVTPMEKEPGGCLPVLVALVVLPFASIALLLGA